MIGVAAKPSDLPWVTEFFELFKTPWEIATPGKHYRVLLSAATDATEDYTADLTLAYGSEELSIDRRFEIRADRITGGTIDWGDRKLPIYGAAARFSGDLSRDVLRSGPATFSYQRTCGRTTVRRFGYDLFTEVSWLLTNGQPNANSASPTLEFHIDLVRECLADAGIPYVEVPARPYGHGLVCCLTHDVDFFGIRRHRGDATLAGFALRATAGTVIEVLRGRRRLDEAARNVAAVFSLPLVFLGIARDFWNPFRDYARVERGKASTFFLIPFKGRPGVGPDGQRRRLRAAPYGAGEIRADISQHRSQATAEFGVHGIDAWRDAAAGGAELREVEAATGEVAPGVRMHWLYFSTESPRALEQAGFAYDSTYGFNDAIGYRAGTAQVFRLPGCEHLLELPMAIMDTALFYVARMGLYPQQAVEQCRAVVRDVRQFGGALVINWHDRSLAPERQWGRSYRQLLGALEAENAWFATGRQAVDWFRWRRAIRFIVDGTPERVQVAAPTAPAGLPAASVRVRRHQRSGHVEETRFAGNTHTLTL